MLWLAAFKTLKDNKFRYIAMIVGFFLFVAPFAFLTNAVLYLVGNQADATLHTFCFRMPFDWFFSGRIYMLFGSVAAMFVLGVVVLAFFAGPVFCGWLCPVGAISEGVSRAAPIPNRFRVKLKSTSTTSGLRYGFLVGFITVGILAAYRLSPLISNVCCRYCTSSILQNISSGAFGNPEALAYWHSGGIIVLIAWLLVGGIALYGGRGWCLFFCPLGAVSNISHKLGARFGMFKIKFNKDKCHNCQQCKVSCPMWAIQENKKVDRSLCISCGECTHSCESGAYSYGRGKENA
jgi:ferredoxin-type protein NapH